MRRQRYGPANSLMQVAAAVVGTAAAARAIPVADVAGEVVNQQAEHTYQTDLPQGAYGNGHPAQQDIIGANGRRLILRWVPEGVYVGGCLIADPEVADSLARFITREGESA